jgi:hypothetical protein
VSMGVVNNTDRDHERCFSSFGVQRELARASTTSTTPSDHFAVTFPTNSPKIECHDGDDGGGDAIQLW